jgi:cell division septation protein DedD
MEMKPRVVIPIVIVAVVAVALGLYLFMTKEQIEEKPGVAVTKPAGERPLEIPAEEEKGEEVASVSPAKKEEMPPPTSSHTWAVQVNSCRSYTQAKNLQERLRNRRLGAYITEATIKGEKWYRVRIGFYPTKKEAVEIGKKVVSEFKTKDYWPIQPSKKEIEKHFEETM